MKKMAQASADIMMSRCDCVTGLYVFIVAAMDGYCNLIKWDLLWYDENES